MSNLSSDEADDLEINTISVEEECEEESVEEEDFLHLQDFLNKNTSSFQCLAQVNISRSSLLLDPYYWFPELPNPKLDAFLAAEEPKPIYDKAGRVKYLEICKQLNVKPYRRVLNSLENSYLDLSFFGLQPLEMRALCDALAMNKYIEKLSLQENFLPPESVKYLDGMLLKNSTIRVLDLRMCNIGPEGAKNFRNGFAFNKCVEELDLSRNNLGDEGCLYVAKFMSRNNCVEILNLSHNKLGIDALKALAEMIPENYTLMELDLSWNQLYMEDGMTEFMASLLDNMQIQRLDLSWCGIGDKDNMRPIYNYIRSDLARIVDLDLSNNRLCGLAIIMLKSGLKFNECLALLNVGSNPMTPTEAEFLASVVIEPRNTPNPLKLIDFSGIMVLKTFPKVRQKCRKMGCDIKYEGIFSNYKVEIPDIRVILCKRAKFVAMNQKKKKFRQDFGVFLLRLPTDIRIGRAEIGDYMDKYKIRLDFDLLEGILKEFARKDGDFDHLQLIDMYMKLYPETHLPPPKPKKKKKKGKKDKEKKMKLPDEEQTMSEQTEYTDYTYVSSEVHTEENTDVECEAETAHELDPESEVETQPITTTTAEKIEADDATISSDLFKSVLEGGDQSDATTVASNAPTNP